MASTLKILLIEDNPADARLIAEMLADAGPGGTAFGKPFELAWVDNLSTGLERLRGEDIDMVLLDLGLPESCGLDTMRRLFAQQLRLPAMVVLSGLSDEDVALSALQNGAQDYLIKGQVDGPLLARAIRYAIGRAQAENALREAAARLEQRVHERTAELARAVAALQTEIGERRQAEDSLREHRKHLEELVCQRTTELDAARERAESANLAKSQFVATLSHDLRTPLNGILGFAQVLQWDESLTERQRHAIDAIHHSGEHLLTMTNDLLDMAKIESGKFELCRSDFDLPEFVSVVADILEVKRAQKPALRLACELSADLPRVIHADERRLRQVLLNLLDNALKFTTEGQVTLRIAPPSPGRLRLEIHDTGEALSEAQIARLFRPFEQLGPAKERSLGTGLGLVICRQLVALMGGEIHVHSRSGQGNLFWFEIDAAAAGEPREATPASNALPAVQPQ
jgi:signal transduction histidine kinase